MSEISDLNFNKVIDDLLKKEGGYVNDPSDKGGETKYGISKRSYPEVDIKNLNIKDVKEIYKKDFWDDKFYSEILDCIIAGRLFNFAVNAGNKAVNIICQRAIRACGVNLEDDGIIGVKTLEALKTIDYSNFDIALKCEIAGYYRCIVAKNPTQDKFIKGWLNRAYS